MLNNNAELVMAAAKAVSRVAVQFVLVRDLQEGYSRRTDMSLEDERAKLVRLVNNATGKVLDLDKVSHFLPKHYNISEKVGRLEMCLDANDIISSLIADLSDKQMAV